MGVPNLRAIRDWCKESFLSKQQILDSKDSIESNNAPGKLADALVIKEVFQSVSNGKELIASAITDKGIEADAGDTFAQMADKITQIESSGESGGSDTGGGLTSPLTLKVTHSGGGATTELINILTYFPIKKVKKLVIKSLKIGAKKGVAAASSVTINFDIYGKKSASSGTTMITREYAWATSTNMTSTTVSEKEIDLAEYDSIEYFNIFKSAGSGTTYPFTYSVDAELELYF